MTNIDVCHVRTSENIAAAAALIAPPKTLDELVAECEAAGWSWELRHRNECAFSLRDGRCAIATRDWWAQVDVASIETGSVWLEAQGDSAVKALSGAMAGVRAALAKGKGLAA